MAIDFPVATTVGQTYTDPGSGSTFVVTVVGPPAQWVGSGSSTNLDATYLRKDASNDPVTGTLTVTPSTNVEGLVVTQGATQTAAALRITNEGSGNALIVEDSANPDSTPVAIDSSGRLLVGNTIARTNIRRVPSSDVGAAPCVQIEGVDDNRRRVAIISSTSDNLGGSLALAAQRSGTIGGNTIVGDNASLGSVQFNGSDGTNFIPAASILGQTDGTPGTNNMPGRLVFKTRADGAETTEERMRIDSAGRLLIGTSSAVSLNNGITAGLELHSLITTNGASASIARFSNDGKAGPQLNFGKSRSNTTLSPGGIVQEDDALGEISFCGDDGTDIDTEAARIRGEVDGTPGANDMPGRLVFSTTSNGGSSPTERMRITNNGEVRIGNSAGVDITSSSSNGSNFTSAGAATFARAGNTPLFIGRNTDDGILVIFYQNGTSEGNISVAGSTVSYNPFLGSHWGRLADGSKPDILPGTILDTVDQLIEWKQAKFTVDGEEKIAAYNGAAEVGDTVEIDYEGTSYSAIVQNEEEEPEELNKHVCVKVNDTASSKAVFGVFLGWDDDIPENMVSTWNDLYCAAVGNYFVRIADGETLEIGSLIEADGNGCGIVQDDDIIRSKTVAKITSTIPQKVYDDGSFLVTCVLCCG